MAETFSFLSFFAFLNLIIILIKENKKKLTLCQRNAKISIKILDYSKKSIFLEYKKKALIFKIWV